MAQAKQLGFTLTTIVLVIVALVVLGIIAWRVIDAQKPPTAQNTQQDNYQSAPQADPNEGSVVIKEWGVRFKPVEGLDGVVYFKPKTVSGDSFTFVTNELMKLEPSCGKDSHMIPIGMLTRSENPSPYDGGVITVIDGFSYQYRSSGASCSETEEGLKMEANVLTWVSRSLESLEVAK